MNSIVIRMVMFNFLHVGFMLIANFLWISIRTFVTHEVGKEFEHLNAISKLLAVAFGSILAAFTVGLPVVLLTIFAIQLCSIFSIMVTMLIFKDRSRSLVYSELITVSIMLLFYGYVCFYIIKVDLLFWIGFILFLMVEYLKYRKFSELTARLDGPDQ